MINLTFQPEIFSFFRKKGQVKMINYYIYILDVPVLRITVYCGN